MGGAWWQLQPSWFDGVQPVVAIEATWQVATRAPRSMQTIEKVLLSGVALPALTWWMVALF
jgi:hypothetical protein